ncbi:MAG TPA: 2-oxo-tetronate isomerase [Aliidongia sp.]|nr:2-oxo-tetronate isomerase [Aliidongia sp.]
MPRFAANLSWLFTELPFPDRFAAAADAGFKGVEILTPYGHSEAEIAASLDETGLELVLLNLPAGDPAKGERGFAALPGREDEFAASLETAIRYAQALDCPRLHCLAGILPPGTDLAAARDTYIRNLRHAAARADGAGITILIEPINDRDMPGYFLNRPSEAPTIIEAVDAANLRLQLDFYHCQVMEGDLATRLRALAPLIGHMQIAGVPDRTEPDRGEVNYPYLFDRIDALGYQGWIGCEYRPAAGTLSGLGWAERWLGS